MQLRGWSNLPLSREDKKRGCALKKQDRAPAWALTAKLGWSETKNMAISVQKKARCTVLIKNITHEGVTIVSLSACKRESSTQNGTLAASPVGGACYPYSN